MEDFQNSQFQDLHFAASAGDEDAVVALLKRGDDINAFDDIGFTPLHHAAASERLNVMRLLLKAGANANAHDESKIGNTPLGEVAGKCSFELAKLLIDAGADPTIQGWMQLSALDRAKEREGEEGQRVYELLFETARKRG